MTETPPTPPPKPSLHFNWEDWLPYLEDSDLTENQKREMMETLWSIVLAFVDLGWEAVDTPKETCGKALDLKAALTAAMLHSRDTIQNREEA